MNGRSSRACRRLPAALQAFLARRAVQPRRPAPPDRADDRGAASGFRSRRRRRCRPSRVSAWCCNELARGDTELASRIVTASPDVTVSTNLGAWVNRRGLFARAEKADLFRSEKIPSTFNWDVLAEGTAYRARHRRDEPVHPDVGAGAVARHQRRTAAAGRDAVRSLHRARPRCPELRLLSGRALHGGGDAVGRHAGARKAARTSRSRRR